MYGELLCEIVQRIEGVARVEPLLILAVAALYLAVVARCVRTDQLMPDAKLGGSFFKQSRQVTFTVGEAIGKLGTVVRLDALHFDPTSYILGKHACPARRGAEYEGPRQVFFKTCKSLLRLTRECQSISYDAMSA